MVLIAIFGEFVAPHSATSIDGPRLQAPSWSYPFGTDNLFRDQFSRVLIGARISLGIGLGSVVLSTLIGVFLGVTSGYLGGWWDMVVRFQSSQPSTKSINYAILNRRGRL